MSCDALSSPHHPHYGQYHHRQGQKDAHLIAKDALIHETHTLPISSISTSPVTISTSLALFAIQTTLQILFRDDRNDCQKDLKSESRRQLMSDSKYAMAYEGNGVPKLTEFPVTAAGDFMSTPSPLTSAPKTSHFPIASPSISTLDLNTSLPIVSSSSSSSLLSSLAVILPHLPAVHQPSGLYSSNQEKKVVLEQTETQLSANLFTPSSSPAVSPSTTNPPELFSGLASKARQVLVDVDEVIRSAGLQQQQRRRRRSMVQQRQRHCQGQGQSPIHGRGLSLAFASFCEQLLLANQAWKHERQLKALKSSLSQAQARVQMWEESDRVRRNNTSSAGGVSSAFGSFCERLVRQNRVWDLEQEVALLRAEGEWQRSARVAAITRAGRRMAAEARKDSMIGELVRELVKDCQALRREVKEVRQRDAQFAPLKAYRELRREAEGLRLARRASVAGQIVADDVEEAMCDTMKRLRERVEWLEREVEKHEKSVEDFSSLRTLFEGENQSERLRANGESEQSKQENEKKDKDEDGEEDVTKCWMSLSPSLSLSELSELSTSSSTCVSSPGGKDGVAFGNCASKRLIPKKSVEKFRLATSGVPQLPTPSPSPLRKQCTSRTLGAVNSTGNEDLEAEKEEGKSLSPLVFDSSVRTESSASATARMTANTVDTQASARRSRNSKLPFSVNSTSSAAVTFLRPCQQSSQRNENWRSGSALSSSRSGNSSRTSSRLSHRFCSTPSEYSSWSNSTTGRVRFDLKLKQKAPWKY